MLARHLPVPVPGAAHTRALDGRPTHSRQLLREECGLAEGADKVKERIRGLYTLGMVNAGIWAIAIIALVFVIQRAPSAKGLFVIMAGGVAVSVALLTAIGKAR